MMAYLLINWPTPKTRMEDMPMINKDDIKKNKRRSFGREKIRRLFNYKWILKNIGFFIFLSSLAVLYIANGHMADNRIRKISETARQLKDLQYEYKTVKSEVMFRSKESEIVKAAEPLGLKMDSLPPVRIKAESGQPE